MEISKKDAAEIVNEISKLIGLKINIVGSDAVIIANSDPERVGNFHEATYEIISKKLDELVVYSNTQYKGTNAGTNLPLIIDDEIIGVVGITGPHKVAQSYGKVIKKLIEVLLESKAAEDRIMQRRQALDRYCNAWVCSTQTVLNDAFIQQGRTFGVDITLPRRIMIISMPEGENEKVVGTVQSIVSRAGEGDCVFLTSHSVVAILPNQTDEAAGELAELIRGELSQAGYESYIGIDNGADSFYRIHQQYERAKLALKAGLRLKDRQIIFYDNLSLELVLDDISIESKLRYIRKIFKDYSVEEMERDICTISALYEEDGSIKRAAQRLFIHPNTLQYQLKRVEERTGYDPRKLSHAAVFGVAELFINDLRGYLREAD
ncbi:MAG: helix-turn-helix domain-containing protein [Clostridiales bacterium]|nr:helix-turn-helix domain-containing protein [Clostridiales bacterium]